jgi:hypothetical protein
MPESCRSLPNLEIEVGHIYLAMESLLKLLWARGFKEQCQCLAQVAAGVLYVIPLAGDIQFRTEGDEPITFALDYRREVFGVLHD